MNPFIKFIQKKFSDTTIRAIRIIFAIVYMGALYYNFFIQDTPNIIQDKLFWQLIDDTTRMIISYIMVVFGLFPLIMGITNICVAKGKYMRITQIIYAIILFYFSHIIVESANMDIDVLVFFMAFLPLFGGITGKLITSKCLNYGYKVTKIRV